MQPEEHLKCSKEHEASIPNQTGPGGPRDLGSMLALRRRLS